MKSSIGALLRHHILLTFQKDGVKISNHVRITNSFCDYFTNIEQKLSGEILSTNSSPSDFLLGSSFESISPKPLTVDELNNIVKIFDAKKASGHDNIPLKIIQQSYQNIVHPL